jgi:thiol-disulfide isomerase/thioredoxin
VRVEKRKLGAPEIGRVWLNCSALSFRQLRGRMALVDFWDYTCANCIPTLPDVQAWPEDYKDNGLTAIGLQARRSSPSRSPSPTLERGIREFGPTYPMAVESNHEIGKAFANRDWPSALRMKARSWSTRHRGMLW